MTKKKAVVGSRTMKLGPTDSVLLLTKDGLPTVYIPEYKEDERVSDETLLLVAFALRLTDKRFCTSLRKWFENKAEELDIKEEE